MRSPALLIFGDCQVILLKISKWWSSSREAVAKPANAAA
jgi:hypothetical protein